MKLAGKTKVTEKRERDVPELTSEFGNKPKYFSSKYKQITEAHLTDYDESKSLLGKICGIQM